MAAGIWSQGAALSVNGDLVQETQKCPYDECKIPPPISETSILFRESVKDVPIEGFDYPMWVVKSQ